MAGFLTVTASGAGGVAAAPAVGHNTLDQAYDQGAVGAGRIVTLDSGAVQLDVAQTAGTAFQISVPGAAPIVLSGTTFGISLDLQTNVTGGANRVEGISMAIPDSSSTATRGINILSRQSAGIFAEYRFLASTLTGTLTGELINLNSGVVPGANAIIGSDIRIAASSSGLSRAIDIDTRQTAGTWIEASAGGAVTLSSNIDLALFDGLTNITAGANQVRGVVIGIPGSSNAGTRGLNVVTAQTAGTLAEYEFTTSTLSGTLTGIQLNLLSGVTPGANVVFGVVIQIPGSSSTLTRAIDIDTRQTAGTWIEGRAGSAVALSGSITPVSVDARTNITIGANFVRAARFLGPLTQVDLGLTDGSSGSGAETIEGLRVQNSASTNTSSVVITAIGAQPGGTLMNLSVGAVTLTAALTGLSLNLVPTATGGNQTTGLVIDTAGSGDILIEGSAAAAVNVRMFGDGDTVLGGNAMSGTERLRVIGGVLISSDIEIDGALNHDGTTAGFYGTAPATQQTITGSRAGNAALASLLTGLATTGLIIDSTVV